MLRRTKPTPPIRVPTGTRAGVGRTATATTKKATREWRGKEPRIYTAVPRLCKHAAVNINTGVPPTFGRFCSPLVWYIAHEPI